MISSSLQSSPLKSLSSHTHPFIERSGIQLYRAQDLTTPFWPKSVEGDYIQKFFSPFMEKGIHHYIENIQTELLILVWGDLIFPLTVNEAEYENSYICSPYSYYFSYAMQSNVFNQGGIQSILKGILWGSSKILKRFHINKVLIVNNWPFSTTLYPSMQPDQIKTIAAFLREQFPEHALIFRSVDPYTNPVCYHTLKGEGFDYIAHRQIFFIDSAQQADLLQARLFKTDQKQLKNSGYEVIDQRQLSEKDIPRLLELYRSLFIDKYSSLNPQFNENFLHLMLTHQLMHFKAIRKEGRLDGVVGYVQRNGKLFCPFFGYDQTLPKDPSLYRLLSTLLMLEAHQQGLLFHQSAGASLFKSMRKASCCIEYLAVYHRHLPFTRRLPWLMLKSLCNSLGVFYMKRY